MADFINPSFELPGSEPGLALDWAYTTVSSLLEFSTFSRGTATVVVDYLPVDFETLGATVVNQSDGSIFVITAPGSLEAFDDFEFGWAANQFYYFAQPTSHIEAALISGAKRVEDLESGWKNDLGYLASLDALTTETFTETFNGNWPASAPAFLRNAFELVDYGYFKSGTPLDTFTDLSSLAAPNYSSDVRLFVLSTGTQQNTIFSLRAVTNLNIGANFFTFLSFPTGKSSLKANTGASATETHIPITTVAPLVTNAHVGSWLRYNGEYRQIVANSTVSVTVSPGFKERPAASQPVEIAPLIKFNGAPTSIDLTTYAGIRDFVFPGVIDSGNDIGEFRLVGDPGAALQRAEFV